MPRVRYLGTGGYYMRQGPDFEAEGDEADVDGETADRLTGRGDFEVVGETPDDEIHEEDGPPDLAWDPTDHTVDEVREHVDSIDGDNLADELQQIRQAEASGKDRTTALEAIDARLDNLEG